jgi:hypothetical protein
MDGGARVFAPVIPFISASIAMVIRAGVARPADDNRGTMLDNRGSCAIATTATLALAALLGPRFATQLWRGKGVVIADGPCGNLPGGGVVMDDHLPFIHIVTRRPAIAQPEELSVADFQAGLSSDEVQSTFLRELRDLASDDVLLTSFTKGRGNDSIVFIRTRATQPEAMGRAPTSCVSARSEGAFWLVDMR